MLICIFVEIFVFPARISLTENFSDRFFTIKLKYVILNDSHFFLYKNCHPGYISNKKIRTFKVSYESKHSS